MSDNLEPIRALAFAVVKRAAEDLTLTYGIEAAHIRRDAYRFLTEVLWSDDCLWKAILSDCLPHQPILRLVHSKVRRLPNGEVDILKK